MNGSLRSPSSAVVSWSEAEQAAVLVHLPLAPEHLPGVTANLAQLRGYADLLAEFPLDADQEAAPVFEP